MPIDIKGKLDPQFEKRPDETLEEYYARTPTPDRPGEVPAEGTGGINAFTEAMRQAMNEGATKRKVAGMEQFAPLTEGLKPGSLSSVVDIIKSSVGKSAEDIFAGAVALQKDVLEAEQVKREQSLDLLSTFAKDGTLGELPDSALLSLGRSAGLGEGATLAWRSRIKTAADIDTKMAELEVVKIQSEIEENKAQVREIEQELSEDKLAPTVVTLGYADRVETDPEFELENVPGDERDRVNAYLFNTKINVEAVDYDKLWTKMNVNKKLNKPALNLTDHEWRILVNEQYEAGFDYEKVVSDITEADYLANKDRGNIIAQERFGIRTIQPTDEEAEGEVGAFISLPGGGDITKFLEEKPKTGEEFLTGVESEAPDFTSFPSAFRF